METAELHSIPPPSINNEWSVTWSHSPFLILLMIEHEFHTAQNEFNLYHISETRIGCKDYDLIHFLKEWFIALCKCTVIIPKLNWNLSHELKIVTSLYILELTLLYPQPCSYLQVIQAWAHFRQRFVKFSMNGSLFQ